MRLKSIWEVLRDTGKRFSQDSVTTLGAALAYYAIFSIAPLLVIAISVAGLVFGEQGARHQMIQQIQGVVGERSASMVESMMASQTRSGSWIATAIGIIVLLLGASGIFGQLKTSLNLIWHVQPRPGRGVLGLLWDRLVALVVVLGIGLLLLCTMLLSTVVSSLYNSMNQLISVPGFVARLVQLLVSLVILVALFALIFKVLADVKIRRRDLWVGAMMTGLLFLGGEYLLGLYLSHEAAGSPYGAAGSVVLILVWIYYSSLILLAGAEFTEVYARHRGSNIEPAEYAEWIPRQGMAGEPT